MKTLFSLIIVAVLMLFAVPDAQAQLQANPNNFNYYYFYPMTGTSARAYVTNTTDTLPNSAIAFWYNSTPSTVPGGGSFIGLRFINADSCYAYIYVDAKYGTEWANAVYTDSVEVAYADTAEILFRGVATERLGGSLVRALRVRVNFQNVTQGAIDETDSPTYRAHYLWKP